MILIFLFGIPTDPALAGITANIFFVFFTHYYSPLIYLFILYDFFVPIQ